MNKDTAREALLAANVALGSISPPIAYWLDCGSLLGAVREGDIMDHDLDVDFSCKDWERHEEIAEAMVAAGLQMFKVHGTPEHGYEQRFKLHNIKVDVFYFYEGTARGPEEGTCWQGSWDHDKLIESRFPTEIVRDVLPFEFHDATVPVPIEFEALLTARYGDWTVPVTKWDWRSDPECIVPPIADVTFLLKSFMRPTITIRAIRSIRATYGDDVAVLVVDDSDISEEFAGEVRSMGARLLRMPYDSGLSAGRNAGLREVATKYVVIMDDDMVVSEATRLEGMLELLELGDIVCGSMIQSGSVIDWQGTYDLTADQGLRLVPHDKRYETLGRHIRWAKVDFGLNCLVSTTAFLRAHPWDEALKLHEHTDFFLRLRDEATVIFTPDCVFEHKPERKGTYLKMRRRREFRLLFFDKHQLRYHVGISGHLDVWTPKDELALRRLKQEGGPSMGLEIANKKDVAKAQKGGLVLQRRLYLDARGKVTDNVRQGVRLFGIPGQTVAPELARSVGLIPAESSRPRSSTPKATTSSSLKPVDLRRANLDALQKAARDRDLDDSGTKKQIRDRILEHEEKSGAGR